MKKAFIIILIVAIVAFTWYQAKRVPPEEITSLSAQTTYCFSRDVEATSEAPYEVHEQITFSINDNQVNGIKSGTQTGPDMTNGYEGTLSGTKNGTDLSLLFSYTIEGSKQSEQEIYTLSDTALIKQRYPLIEQEGILVPDMTKPFAEQMYLEVRCGE